MSVTDMPVVCIDNASFFTYVNKAFEDAYGWKSKELIGKSVTTIMPKHMKNAHMVGFSRFVVTEQSRVLGKPLPLKICKSDGEVQDMKLFIRGEKKDSTWRFAAIIKPASNV